ncbi:hypothetical protein MML61_27625 (plasmid) [Mycobacterium marinum]|uniref:hypothetical protein n=1 Tax=Mycobacterium marinum TaxID=1781 RepID=UPI00045FCB3C|nr:hypothetical protein [Mycobacterium marinum]WCS21185.1 hypothetical protein MML61_27625 [Mycobacterium marinum]WOR07542.1 hypothetical protein QDR78_27505 [Mycobacterium marinum]GJO49621.1 hypothetical protein NJB1604_34190 [Mycobacterium marinum]CDM79578.1 hypothetical protein MMARE11_p00760 [Mycobacterium marinum E11]
MTDPQYPNTDSDLAKAWLCPTNSSLYEHDPGLAMRDIGSSLEPHWVTRSEAFRDFYSRQLLADIEADIVSYLQESELKVDVRGVMP